MTGSGTIEELETRSVVGSERENNRETEREWAGEEGVEIVFEGTFLAMGSFLVVLQRNWR